MNLKMNQISDKVTNEELLQLLLDHLIIDGFGLVRYVDINTDLDKKFDQSCKEVEIIKEAVKNAQRIRNK